MTKEEFELKVGEVYDVVQSLIEDTGVNYHSSLYGFLFTASGSLNLAIRHSDEYDRIIEVELNHD